MPTTRIPILDAPVSRPKTGSPTRAQVEAVQTYKEKAEQARKRNNSVGVRVPDNIASYDYAYASSPGQGTAIPAILKPSNSPPAPAGAFPVSPAAVQHKWTPKPEPVIPKSKISSNTSVFRKPTVLGVTTSAAILEESVAYVRADAKTGATRATTPPRSTTVKISLKPKTPSPTGSPSKAPAMPAAKVERCKPESGRHACAIEHCKGTYYRSPCMEDEERQRRSPSPTKTMPNFTRQYSLEGDSIFGYKVKDPLGTVAGADKSASNSDEEKPKTAASRKPEDARKQHKRTLADRWPWIRRDNDARSAPIGKPPSMPAPDPPVRAPVRPATKRPNSVYVSPFDALATLPTTTPPPARPTPARPAAAAKSTARSKSVSHTTPDGVLSFDSGMKRMQDFVVVSVKVGLALYIIVALWFVLDALREALCVVCVPLRVVVLFVWAVVGSTGRAVGVVAGILGGKVRVLGR
ncbi:hypothetical protein E8E12_004565 [Didymella heteroderae]|uniref:Uncharacterized protein n=1 Tax=Didymella heteroderae TaxID=1769908 RepID=A0A9P4WNZ6_9PLEO|nr:hypothetical protein E8E12_004565 [Didymella heteroderae]